MEFKGVNSVFEVYFYRDDPDLDQSPSELYMCSGHDLCEYF